jgi:hypothetical protein
MLRVRSGIVVLLLALPALAGLVAAAPAGARSSDDAPTVAAEDPAVQAFVAAAKQYVDVAAPVIDEAVGRENDAIGACQTLIDGAPGRVQPRLGDLIATDLASVTWRAMLPAYGQLVAQLTDAAPADPILRGAADGAWTLKQLQQPLLERRVAACRLVRQWKALRWTRSFPAKHPHEFASSLVSPDGRAQALAARQAIEAAGQRLQELGATPGDAILFTSVVGSSLI